jgi:broad specificity phosphatase PhoE
MLRRRLSACCAFALALLLCASVRADDKLWELLKSGGQVVLMRHAITTPGVGDPEGMVLSNCSTQRNLSDEGRAHAALIGQAFRSHGITVTQVIASPWCRAIDTARIAFGKAPETSTALSNLFGRSDPDGKQVAALRMLVSKKPGSGNVVMVSHGSTILALTGISPATGEMVVVTPQGNGKFSVAGRLEVSAR